MPVNRAACAARGDADAGAAAVPASARQAARQSESGHRDDNWFGGPDLVPPAGRSGAPPRGAPRRSRAWVWVSSGECAVPEAVSVGALVVVDGPDDEGAAVERPAVDAGADGVAAESALGRVGEVGYLVADDQPPAV